MCLVQAPANATSVWDGFEDMNDWEVRNKIRWDELDTEIEESEQSSLDR